jgi:hypothetical protein
MKAIIAGVLSLFAITANAGGIDCRSGVDHKHPKCLVRPNVVVQHVHHGHRHWNHHRHHAPVIVHRHHNDWVVPLVGGVVLGAVINESLDRKNEQPSQPQCSEWREVMQNDGTIVRERTCYQK